MTITENKQETAPTFEPLQLMGTFWIFFGLVILFSTFFVKATPQVPLVRGVFTNIISGLILFGVGLFCYVKGRRKKAKNPR